MANSREEQLRNSRRLARQLLGAVALVLVVIGLFTVLNWCVGALRAALDDSDRRERYADRVYGLVMFDVLPFDDVSQVDSSVFRQAAIWGTVYQAQKDGTLDDYDRDTETGSLILPQLEIDTYLTNLLGPPSTWTSFSAAARTASGICLPCRKARCRWKPRLPPRRRPPVRWMTRRHWCRISWIPA